MNCVKCNAPLDTGVRFCGACGTQQPGAVVPQAAVMGNAKTMFQGSSGPSPVSAAPKPVVKAADDVSYAATIAPGSTAMPVPTPVKAQQAVVPTAQTMMAAAPVAGAHLPSSVQSALANPVKIADGWDGDLTGKTLNNRYHVEGKLGEGGFGAVYRARQTQMNRNVALKVLHARMAKDAQVVGRFKREAQASSLLRAAHTVQVYDFDQTPEGVMYLAMEMLEGKSLHAVMAQDGPLEPMRVGRILDGVADSLDEAHRQGIVHRDIKPENIYLEPRPTADFVKVLDFGIAKIVSGDGLGSQPALTAAGQTLGTLEYMSPEQLMGKQLDGRSDLYALGILAYELLTGDLPFPGKTPGEIITAHLKTMPPPPSTVQPGIPPLLDQIVLKLVAKNRDERYKDTAELRDALRRLAAGEGPAAAAPAPAPSRPASVNTPAPAPAASTPAKKGSPQIFMIAIGLLVGIGAVLVALLLKR